MHITTMLRPDCREKTLDFFSYPRLNFAKESQGASIKAQFSQIVCGCVHPHSVRITPCTLRADHRFGFLQTLSI